MARCNLPYAGMIRFRFNGSACLASQLLLKLPEVSANIGAVVAEGNGAHPLSLARPKGAHYLPPMTELKSIPRRTPPKPKPPLKCAEVLTSVRLTPNMQRITFTGPDVAGFTPDRAGANLKICVPKTGTPDDVFRAELADNSAAKIMRTFTVQSSDPEAGTMTIDFALHEPAGHAPAGDWARDAKPGDLLGYRGPSDKKLTEFYANRYVLAGDMTALPALSAILAQLPGNAKGDAFFEITDPADAQALDAPDGVTIHWLHHPEPAKPSELAVNKIKGLGLENHGSSLQVAIAGEHSVVATLKDYFFGDLGLDPARNYISPYWKVGLTENEHQVLKRTEQS